MRNVTIAPNWVVINEDDKLEYFTIFPDWVLINKETQVGHLCYQSFDGECDNFLACTGERIIGDDYTHWHHNTNTGMLIAYKVPEDHIGIRPFKDTIFCELCHNIDLMRQLGE